MAIPSCGLSRLFCVALGLAFLLAAASPALAQPTEFRRCAVMELYPELLPKNYHPDASTLKRDRALVAGQLEQFRRGADAVYTVPVVIHVVHHVTDAVPGTGSNLSDAQATSQLQVLNEDFRALLGTPGQSIYPDSIAADVRVEFVLATVDPDGNPTTGIVRHPRSDYVPGVGYDPALGYPGQFDLAVKPETIWDPERYMNMWSADLGPLLLGYAQFPEGSGLAGMPSDPQDPNTDGVVINYSAFGSSDLAPGTYNPPYDKGRTATHEVGHFLGLRHIWGDGDCAVDDFARDTPRAADSNGGCPAINTCDDTAYGALVDFPDMVENYMDYTEDTCMNTFTEGQKARVRQVLDVSPRRATLVGNTPNRAGLVVAKSDGGAAVRDGETLTYTLTVTNDADDPATGVVLTDEVPARTVYVAGSASDGGSVAGGTVTWSLGDLAPDASATRSFQVTVATGEGSAFLFQDGIEDGGGSWTVGGLLPTWAITTGDAHRGAASWFAQDPDNESDQWLDLDASDPLPADALFRFWHRYNTEAGFDAGVAELSTDGGLTWEDMGPYLIQNGYTSTIPPENNVHLGGRDVFDGDSGGFLETIADLGGFEGERVAVRFRFASDVLTPQEGWYVDDVAFATRLVSVSGTATVASAEGETASAPLSTDVLPALTPAVTLALVPQDAPVVVPAEGGQVTFTATLTNTTGAAQSVQAWSEATLPNGASRGPLVGPVNVRLAAGRTLTRTLAQTVPGNAPAGTYTYTGYVGTFPDGALDSDGFAVTKAGGSAARETPPSAAGWLVVDLATGAPVTAGDRWTADETTAATLAASASAPSTFSLSAAHPNPFDAATTLGVAVPSAARVRLVVYDVLGRAVAVLLDGELEAGQHRVRLDASGLPSGTYLVRMEAEGVSGTFVETQRVTRLR